MSEPQLISPLLDGFVMGDPISDHHGVCCCPAMHLESDKKYMVKVISIPASQAKLAALLLAGAFSDRESAIAYFQELTEDVVEETKLLEKLSRFEGFVSYEDWQVVPKEGDAGFDIYLLGEYRPTLDVLLQRNSMTHLEAINLGLDLCTALSVARRMGYIYADLQPSNIHICNEREYRIGDLGFLSLSSLPYASLPEKYHSNYTPPEVLDAYSALNGTLDTYAVGLILYQAYHDGVLPDTTVALESPRYADYELAEIIMKACAVNPEERWQDPVQMGQALSSYMQRNGVNDTPIVPRQPLEEIPETESIPEDAEQEQDPSTDAILAEVDVALESEESTQIREDAEENETAQEETTEILAQADDLIAHQLPDPVVAPEAVEIVLPPPVEESEGNEEAPVLEESAAEDTPSQEETPVEETDSVEPEEPTEKRKFSKKTVTAGIIALLVAIFLGVGGFLFYHNYYLQTIDDMILSDVEDRLYVTLKTDISDEKLTVICTDTHGNTRRQPVKDGIATFDGLNPGTTFKVQVCIDGFHKLLGETTEIYTSAKQTIIGNLHISTGPEDGTAIISFTVQGPDTNQWRVHYTAEGEAEKTAVFAGHMVTLSGLSVGKEYTFTLESEQELYLSGNNTITHTASKIVYAENLQILSFKNQTLCVAWDNPQGLDVKSWTVRCYNDAGYDRTVTTSATTAEFEGLDTGANYTVEVTAEGMTIGVRTYLTANFIIIQDIQVDTSNPDSLSVSWTFEGVAPAEGWHLLYTVDGVQEQQVIQCAENAGIITPLLPGAHYRITVQPANGANSFGGTLEFDAPAAQSFNRYQITKDDIIFSMCITPNVENWNRFDVAEKAYTATFQAGVSGSFVMHLNRDTIASEDEVVALYVIRDADGKLVSNHFESRTWTSMWYQNYGKLTIPVMPETVGKYTVDIYFQGAFVHSQDFEILTAE